MFAFTVKRILGAIPTLLAIIAVAFFMMRAAPGGPLDQEKPLPPEIRKNIEEYYGLNEPLHIQFKNYLVGIMQGDFGTSFKYKDRPVADIIGDGYPVSFKLGVTAMILATLLGIIFGSIAALKQNKRTDYSIMTLSMIGVVIPGFVMAPILSLFFGILLPDYMLETFGISGFGLPVAGWRDGAFPNMILPVTALTLPYLAYISRLTRGSMIEVLRSNYIRTARAKGLPERITLFRHALKPALLPVVSFLGPATAGIITGSVVIEKIFGLPGIGRDFVEGSFNRDYPLVMGVVVFYGSIIILFNLIVDLIYAWLDPKVRYD